MLRVSVILYDVHIPLQCVNTVAIVHVVHEICQLPLSAKLNRYMMCVNNQYVL